MEQIRKKYYYLCNHFGGVTKAPTGPNILVVLHSAVMCPLRRKNLIINQIFVLPLKKGGHTKLAGVYTLLVRPLSTKLIVCFPKNTRMI